MDHGAVGEIVREGVGVNRGAHHDEAQPVPRTRCGGAAALVAIVVIGLAGLVVRRRLGRRCGRQGRVGRQPGRLPPKGTAEEQEEQVQVDVALVRLVDDHVRVRAEDIRRTEDEELKEEAHRHEGAARGAHRGHLVARDGVADGATKDGPALRRHALSERARGQPPRLRHDDFAVWV